MSEPNDAFIAFYEEEVDSLGPCYRGAGFLSLLSEEAFESEESAVSSMAKTLARHSFVFAVAEGAACNAVGGLIMRPLNQQAVLTSNDVLGLTELTLRAAPEGADSFTVQQPLNVNLADDIALMGCSSDV